MVLIGVDDTDSHTEGMCTTWIASEICEQLPAATEPETFLIRLHPAIEHKTRGNGAVAIRADVDRDRAFTIASDVVERWAAHDDPQTNPGIVVTPETNANSAGVKSVASDAIRGPVPRAVIDTAVANEDFATASWGNGRGLIGATAAIGAAAAWAQCEPPMNDWTLEYLVYRQEHRWGTERSVTIADTSAINGLNDVWDTFDPVTDELVCAPNSPCPVLFGIRGEDCSSMQSVANSLEGETWDRTRWFITNQGTDAHLRPGSVDDLCDGKSFRVRGWVSEPPAVRRGGHVHVTISKGEHSLPCIAFSPTGRFREWVRDLRIGDELIVCGEFESGALKLEKFALCRPVLSKRVTPTCPSCSRRMKSAGREQGYRCRSCETSAPGKVLAPVKRSIELGWYEVPPGARRHLAAPLIRRDHELPIHPTSR